MIMEDVIPESVKILKTREKKRVLFLACLMKKYFLEILNGSGKSAPELGSVILLMRRQHSHLIMEFIIRRQDMKIYI